MTAPARVRHHFSAATGISLELPESYEAIDTRGSLEADGFPHTGTPAGELTGEDSGPTHGASYVRYGSHDEPSARVEVDTVTGLTGGDEIGATIAVLDAIAGQGGDVIMRGGQVVDGRWVNTRVIRYGIGLPLTGADSRSQLSGPGAVMLVAAVVFGSMVRTLAFLSGARGWAADQEDFRRALASCRFVDGRWPAPGKPLGPGGADGVPVCVTDPDQLVSLCAPADWQVERTSDHLRFSGPVGDPAPATFTLRRVSDPPTERESFDLYRADRLTALRASTTAVADQGQFGMADEVLVSSAKFERMAGARALAQLQAWIWVGPGRLYAVGAATPRERADQDLPRFEALLRSFRALPEI